MAVRALLGSAIFIFVTAAVDAASCRVAVIGTGIAGGAFSHYLQEFGAANKLSRCEITAFERNAVVGGRLKHVIGFGDSTIIELGGAAWTVTNRYIPELVNATGLIPNHRTNNTSPGVGIWNGNSFVDVEPDIKKDILSDAAIAAAEAVFLGAIERSYARQQDPHPPFETIEEFLELGDLSRYTKSSIRSFFTDRGVAAELIENGMDPLTRAFYNRDSHATCFAFMASATALLSHNSVQGGNSLLCQALLRQAGATVINNATVTAIEADAATQTYTVHYSRDPSSVAQPLTSVSLGPFDAVVIAAPLERTGIRFLPPSLPLPRTTGLDRGFTDWHVTVVQAETINLHQFKNMAKQPVPLPASVDPHECMILTTANASQNPAAPYVCTQPLGKHGSGDGHGVWMVYSDTDITDSLGDLFYKPTQFIHQHWPYTFAKLNPITDAGSQTQPIVLLDMGLGLYNINAIESLATAMEISAIGARNVARLVVKRRRDEIGLFE